MSDRINATWQRGPEVTLSTQYGHFRAAFSAADYVFCQVTDADGRQAHINDSVTAFEFRGQEYIGSVGLYRGEDGTYGLGSEHRAYLSKRPQWTDAPRTHFAAMVAAIAEAVTGYVKDNPEIVKLAALREVSGKLSKAYKAQDEATEALRLASERVAELEAQHRELSK